LLWIVNQPVCQRYFPLHVSRWSSCCWPHPKHES
jgi:hypothetical protein